MNIAIVINQFNSPVVLSGHVSVEPSLPSACPVPASAADGSDTPPSLVSAALISAPADEGTKISELMLEQRMHKEVLKI